MNTHPVCTTGVDYLDLQLDGGIPVGNTVLVTGSSGSGKTTFCMNYLFEGAKKGEPGIFFTITEPLFKLTRNLESYEFYNNELIENGQVNIIDLRVISERLGLNTEKYSAEDAGALLDVLKDIADEIGAKRLIIDSITALCYHLKSEEMIRDFIFKLGTNLALMNCTTLLTSEIPPNTHKYSQYDIEEFISDGIILMGDTEREGDLIRTMQVIKMRGCNHSRIKYALNINTTTGLELTPLLKTNQLEQLLR